MMSQSVYVRDSTEPSAICVSQHSTNSATVAGSSEELNGGDVTEELVDNGTECTNRLSALYSSAKFSDITLLVGGHRYSTHKLLLASSSDVFE